MTNTATHTTTAQRDAFADELDRLGSHTIAAALGYTGNHDDPDLAEILLYAFDGLTEDDGAQALRKLAITH